MFFEFLRVITQLKAMRQGVSTVADYIRRLEELEPTLRRDGPGEGAAEDLIIHALLMGVNCVELYELLLELMEAEYGFDELADVALRHSTGCTDCCVYDERQYEIRKKLNYNMRMNN